MVAAEQREQVLQSTRVMYIAVKDLHSEALDHLSLTAAVFDLGEVDFVALFDLMNKAVMEIDILAARHSLHDERQAL